MKLVNISKIFGVLAFISFVMVIVVFVGILSDGSNANAGLVGAIIYVGLTVIFLLSAILVTLKRIARAMEKSKRE